MKKMYIKSNFKAMFFKPTTNGQSNKGFLLPSTFVSKGLSAPALGLYTCIKALKYIPRPGVRWAFTGPLVLWLFDPSVIHFMVEIFCLMVIHQRSRKTQFATIKLMIYLPKWQFLIQLSTFKGKYNLLIWHCLFIETLHTARRTSHWLKNEIKSVGHHTHFHGNAT